MKLKVFTVYDSKVGAHLQPFYARSTGEAIRSFSQAVMDTNTQFNKYPADFTLFEVGSWDDQSCVFDLNQTPVSLGLAIEFKEVVQ